MQVVSTAVSGRRCQRHVSGDHDKISTWLLRLVFIKCVGMGEAYLFRKRFQEAHALKRAQDDWCEAAIRLNSTHAGCKGRVRLDEPFPENLDLESLVALMRHKVKLNVHCYLPQDIEAMVRHSLEFDFDIAAFHHALSAWQVPDIIKRAKTNITIATFGGMWYDDSLPCILYADVLL